MSIHKFLFVAASILAATGCGSSSSGGGNGIDPTDPDAVMQAVAVKVGGNVGVLRQGTQPQQDPATADSAPKVEAVVTEIEGGDGDEITAPVEFDSDSPLARLYAKLTGSSTFIEVDLAGASKTLSLAKIIDTIPVSLVLPSNINNGSFTLEISIEDNGGLVSNVVRYTVRVGAPAPVASVQDSLQGRWRLNCFDLGDDGSFDQFLEFSGTSFVLTSLDYFENTSCSGTPDDSFVSSGNMVIGNQIVDADGLTVTEIDFIASDFTDLEIIRIEGNRFYLGNDASRSGDQETTRTTRLGFDIFFARTSATPPTSNNLPPSADAGANSAVAEGSMGMLNGSASDPDGQVVSTVWVQISGTNVSLSGADTLSPSFTAPAVDAPTELIFELTVTDDRGATATDTVTVTVNDADLGSGELQITLTWDTATDQDLHVVEPSGEEIDFTNRSSATGGMLDVDDTSGFGPENIFWDTAPNGDYVVSVDYFSGSAATNATVSVSQNGQIIRSATALLQPGQDDLVYFRFTKSGGQITFTSTR